MSCFPSVVLILDWTRFWFCCCSTHTCVVPVQVSSREWSLGALWSSYLTTSTWTIKTCTHTVCGLLHHDGLCVWVFMMTRLWSKAIEAVLPVIIVHVLFTELPACCEKRRQLSWCATCAVLKLYCLEHRVLVWSLLKHLGLLMINLKKFFYVAMQHQRNFNKNQNVHEVGFI